MKRLIYNSKAENGLTMKLVNEILTESINKNRQNNITGMLVYDGDHFIQCIEGEINIIDTLYQKIANDPRHHSLRIIGEEYDHKRVFSNWNMGYMNNAKEIEKIIKNVTGEKIINHNAIAYSHIKLILLQLSYII